jgi:hypothetical protein
LANDKVEQNLEKGLEKVAMEQHKFQGKKTDIRTKAGSSS